MEATKLSPGSRSSTKDSRFIRGSLGSKQARLTAPPLLCSMSGQGCNERAEKAYIRLASLFRSISSVYEVILREHEVHHQLCVTYYVPFAHGVCV
jgi:hypothetical protein